MRKNNNNQGVNQRWEEREKDKESNREWCNND